MSDLKTFNSSGLELRVLMIEGEPWFLGADILHVLYGKAGGVSHAYDVMDASEISKVKRSHFGMRGGKPLNLISESGLYKLIMRSDKPEARKFQDWVTREVLPSIRKTGGYLLNEEARDSARADDR
ncbi:MAG TPA: BRO family protein [Pelagibacterium sp.]|uniref:BRO-N domain-containing protein n=1 Tax=Pelagibacterium sp. TaxID=1967288 RepID=UPI002CB8ED12|nr:BRO family protein [Pelagibacterium sp.]HWJ86593.1 BRO family protein [Pelagibacterium sp.]